MKRKDATSKGREGRDGGKGKKGEMEGRKRRGGGG